MSDNRTSRAAEPARAQGRSGTHPSRRILHDHARTCQSNADVVMLSGYQTDVAADGAADWEALHAQSYDLLIRISGRRRRKAGYFRR